VKDGLGEEVEDAVQQVDLADRDAFGWSATAVHATAQTGTAACPAEAQRRSLRVAASAGQGLFRVGAPQDAKQPPVGAGDHDGCRADEAEVAAQIGGELGERTLSGSLTVTATGRAAAGYGADSTREPSGATTHQTLLSPWPLVSLGLVSPAKWYSGMPL